MDICRGKHAGELQEAFDLALDTSLDPHSQDLPEAQTNGGLVQSPNLWPEEKDWAGAQDLVSYFGCAWL